MLLLILIPFIIGIIIVYLLHNCAWYNGDPFQLPLIVWFLIIIALLIPIINIIACGIILFFLIGSLSNDDLRFNNDHWLFKRY
jgi:hypothetical protein